MHNQHHTEPGAVVAEASIDSLGVMLVAGQVTSVALVQAYLDRINQLDRAGPLLRSVIELNPDAETTAAALDQERANGRVRGPLHGIPILIKDNIDTDDQMLTTAGSLALVGSRPTSDATVVARLRAAGAIILGKTNLSEWANFRSNHSSSGWSGRGRQTKNPYVLDRNPSGSSSGSAVAVAASLCAAALGTETNGSIVSPSSSCGIVGLKPTVGLTSRAGVIPIAATQDSVGPHARSVRDAALLLNVLAGRDPRDPATEQAEVQQTDYTRFLDQNGLRGARIGVLRDANAWNKNSATDTLAETAIRVLQGAGAQIIDPVELLETIASTSDAEYTVLLYEFRHGLNRYLATRQHNLRAEHGAPRTLAELIAFNEAQAELEMPYFGQEVLIEAEQKGTLDEPEYRTALVQSRDTARDTMRHLFEQHRLDALIAPTSTPAWLIDPVHGDRHLGGSSSLSARAGFPIITLPMGYVHGLPVGLSFMGLAYSEPTLLKLAYAYEQLAPARQPPRFLPTVEAG